MKSIFKNTTAKAFAPASVGNLAVGFDLLGFAIHKLGDTVTITTQPQTSTAKDNNNPIVIENILGDDSIPINPQQNTAGAALYPMLDSLKITCPIYVSINKGIPSSSGLGSSAASAVAAVVALNGLLAKPMSEQELFEYALIGESMVSKSKHGDNVGPSLRGGITLTALNNPLLSLPCPERLFYAVIYPNHQISTASARSILQDHVSLAQHVEQSGYLAQFITALHQKNYSLIKTSLKDITIEPQRAHLIPHFFQAKDAMLNNDALGCSISGAGPSIFGLFTDHNSAMRTVEQIKDLYKSNNITTKTFTGTLNAPGAYLL